MVIDLFKIFLKGLLLQVFFALFEQQESDCATVKHASAEYQRKGNHVHNEPKKAHLSARRRSMMRKILPPTGQIRYIATR